MYICLSASYIVHCKERANRVSNDEASSKVKVRIRDVEGSWQQDSLEARHSPGFESEADSNGIQMHQSPVILKFDTDGTAAIPRLLAVSPVTPVPWPDSIRSTVFFQWLSPKLLATLPRQGCPRSLKLSESSNGMRCRA
ncbi:hypothetical protein MCOR02_001024 [Pyricularia oryzae]|uniref:Uncharacterized protein n=3 Tax=Pyricularia oryzae TaxID=318829 RepID=G5EHL5_PYRO7|nr:uncharacterized protein MGG_18049 [Pyricularia oryzae 70-15]ELQ40851.1 hypothetical protein OOU_Y34scaffold00334g21 [Pyricularia oryzae Y34]KAH9437369.1 hypothetical protein MCOR02_001024 [Pyricularia oryzae]EAQ70729.1 hypothetical protein MGCH7_ch7g136 [Pyricularia oryzae 70-15]EHA46620.1 hypothetical protein MGG_18049 [Pyricularia oryzae 70-15]KAI6300085.1 hypothetical protein MCOR34_009108 [Pyricularia oryzae]